MDHHQRHQQRIERFQALYSWDFQPDLNLEQYQTIKPILPHLDQIDEVIFKYAPKHKISDFNKMDLAILRQALYELMYTRTPALVAIDEAVEIAKEYGSEQSSSFINGVLGNYYDNKKTNSKVHMQYQEIEKKLKVLLALVYGYEEQEINDDWDLVEDAGIFSTGLNSPEDDLSFIQKINHTFELEIDPADIRDMISTGEIETFSDLVDFIHEELLGV